MEPAMLDFSSLPQNAPMVFAILITVTVFFLIARIVSARQPVALAFALTPMLLYWTVQQTLA
jgi:hypothetical protein